MGNLSNPWIGYLTRTYQQIKDQLTTRLASNNPELTDHTEQNIMMIIIGMFAGVVEMLGLYIDNMCREAFLATARRFSSVVKLVKLVDYRIKAATPASADIRILFNGSTVGPFVVPQNVIFTSDNGIVFQTITAQLIPPGRSQALIGVVQITPFSNISLGTTNGLAFQSFAIPDNYVHDSMQITINGVPWLLKTTFGLSLATDKIFIVEFDIDGKPYVVFGNGINGEIPPANYPVISNYWETRGEEGNVARASINTLSTALTFPGVTIQSLTNLEAATGGSGYETIERIRINAPLSLRTLYRMVTYQDYIDVTLQAPGVGKAAVDFDCGKTVDIYIVPINGGLAQSPLLSSTLIYDNERRMLTTFLNILPAGITELRFTIKGVSRFRQDPVQTQIDVVDALVEYGKYENQDINKAVRVSDIYALVDNLLKVDYHNLLEISTIPYARPYQHSIQLLWDRQTLPASNSKVTWRLEYYFNGTDDYIRIFRNGSFMTNQLMGTQYTDPQNTFQFTPYMSLYAQGMQWTFTVYPYNKDIELDDFTMPHVDPNNCFITVDPTLSY